MISSRWRVSVALYTHLLIFRVGLVVLLRKFELGTWPGLCIYRMAVAAAGMWWLGVVRDHLINDLEYLQGHISLVAKKAQKLKAVVRLLEQASAADDRAILLCGEATDICGRYQDLLAELQQRKKRLKTCERSHTVSLPVVVSHKPLGEACDAELAWAEP